MSMNIAGMTGSAMPHAMSGASGRMPPQQKMTNLFNQIDTSGSGTISKAQFEQAFQNLNPPGPFKQAGADTVWQALDPNGSGQVSKQDFITNMKKMMVEFRQSHQGASNAAQTASAGIQGLTDIIV